MKKLFNKLKCWIFDHLWFVDGVSADAVCIKCGEFFGKVIVQCFHCANNFQIDKSLARTPYYCPSCR